MADEKVHTINLRREFTKAPSYRKTKKAMIALKEYISKHMKVDVKNVRIWKRGRQNPPAKIKIKSIVKESKAYVELPEFPFEEVKPIETKKTTDKVKEKLQGKVDAKSETKEEKKEDIKALEKEEAKLEKKEHKHEVPLQPDDKLKDSKAKGKEAITDRKTMPRTGKKDSHEGKP